MKKELPLKKSKKYDELPARVGFIDVDCLRFSLYKNQEKQKKVKKEHKEIIKELNEARKKWLECRWSKR